MCCLSAYPMAQLIFLNGLGMVFVVSGKLMATIFTGNEKEKFRIRGSQSGPDGFQTRAGNRARGQTKMLVGVVR